MDRISSGLDARTLWRPMTAEVCRVKFCTGFWMTATLASRISGTRRPSKLKTHSRGCACTLFVIGRGEEGRQTELIITRRGREHARSTPVGPLETHLPYLLAIHTHIVYRCVCILRLDQIYLTRTLAGHVYISPINGNGFYSAMFSQEQTLISTNLTTPSSVRVFYCRRPVLTHCSFNSILHP